jgi:hypothetical protein
MRIAIFQRLIFSITVLLLSLNIGLYAQSPFQLGMGMESFDKANALKILPDNGFIVGGETENPSVQERDMLLIRTDSNGNILWSKTFGGPERETVNDVVLAPDQGFLLAAEKYQPHKVEGENMTLVKTDKQGNLLWKKIYDEGGNETEGFSIATHGNGFVIAGMVKNMNMVSSAFFNMTAEDQGMYMLKVDENGNKQWSRRFDYGADNVSSTGTCVIAASDGSFMVTGNIAKKGSTDKKIERPAINANMSDRRNTFVAKVKPNGNLVWAQEYEGNSLTMGYTIIEKKEGGFLLAGNTNISNSNMDIYLMSLSADGTVQWAKTFGGARFESVADVVQTPEGGWIVSGMTQGLGNGATDILNFKTDKNGNLLWAKTYGGESEEYPSKIATTGNGIVVTGATASYKSRSFDVLLFKTDWNGNSNCMGKPATISVNNFTHTSKRIEKAGMQKVEQGIVPPNMKKPDAGNITENKREAVKANNLCQ